MSVQDLPASLSVEFQSRFQRPPGTESIEKELARWQQMCRDLIDEKDALKKSLASLQEERDQYLKSLYVLLRQDIPFTKEEVFANLGKGPSLEDLVRDNLQLLPS